MSIIKYNLSKVGGKKRRKVVVRQKVIRPAGRERAAAATGMGAMQVAVAFIQAAGGLDQAKQALAMLESIRAAR